MSFKNTFFHCTILFLFSVSAIAAPAGIESGLNLWLKADDSTAVTINESDEITQWDDSAGNGYSFANTGNYPLFVQDATDEVFNFNPYISFTNAARFLKVSNTPNINNSGTITIILAMHKYLDNQVLFQFEDTDNVVTWIAMQNGTLDGSGKASFSAGSVPSNISMLVGVRDDILGDTQKDGFYNGLVYSSYDSSSTIGASLADDDAYLGKNDGAIADYSGLLAEFIIYDRALTNDELQKVHTYLALKYGITLQNSVNYIAADGTILWNMSDTFSYDNGDSTGDYNNNIAGIARDDANDLNQAKSKSVNNNSVITMEQANLGDGQTVLWGHDGFALISTTGEFVTNQIVNSYYNFTASKRIQREWKVRNTSGVVVDVTVDVSSFSLSENMVLMIDSDGKGNNRDDASKYDIVISADSHDGSTAIFSSVTFPDNAVFTFGDEQPLYAVLGLAETISSSSEVGFSWTYPDNIADSFTIYRSGSPVKTVGSTTRNYSQTAKCNTSYTFEIVATDSGGDSDSSSITITTGICPPVPPNSPDNFQASNITSDNVLLTWIDTSSKELGFILQRFNRDTNNIEISFDLDRDIETYQDAGVICETNYTYSIVARGSANNSSSISFNLTTALCAPSNLEINKTDTEINLAWVDNTNLETGFIVTRHIEGDEDNLVEFELSRNTESFIDTEFECGITYIYNLVAIASDGSTSSAISQTLTTTNCPELTNAPSNFSANNITQTSISLTWSDDYDTETGFVLSRNGQLLSNLAANSTSYTDNTVTCSTSYIYILSALQDATQSPSAELNVSSLDCDVVDEPVDPEITEPIPIITSAPSDKSEIPVEPVTPELPIIEPLEPELTVPLPTDPVIPLPAEPNEQPILPSEISSNSPITSTSNSGLPKTSKLGIVPVPTSNHNQISGNLSILKAGVVTGGSLENTNQSIGLVADITLLPDSVLAGGKMSGSNQNQGIVQDIHLTQYSELIGGVVAGQIDNNGLMQNITIAENAILASSLSSGALTGRLRNFGTIQGLMRLQAGSSLFGGIIDGEIIGDVKNPPFIGMAHINEGSILKNVRLSPTAILPDNVTLINVILPNDTTSPDLQDFNLDPNQLSQLTAETIQFEPTIWSILDSHELALIPAEAFAGINAEAMQFMSVRIINQLSLAQFSYIPIAAFTGLTRDNMTAFDPQIMHLWTEAHLTTLNPTEWENALLVSKILANLNPELVSIETIQTILPTSWQIDIQTGALTAPVDGLLSFPAFSNQQVLGDIQLPFIPDTSSRLGFAGLGTGNTVQTSLNQTLKATRLDEVDLSQFIFTQNQFGIFNIVGTGEYEGTVFAFMPDANNIEQAPLDVAVGVALLENGRFRMTTPDFQQFELIPAPNNPRDLQRALGRDGEMLMSPNGDVMMGLNPPQTRRTRFETEVMMIGVFDAFVEPAPDSFCECGFGMEFPSELGFPSFRARSEAQITYADGSKQKIYPTVAYPNHLVDLLQQFENVDKVLYNADGSFTVSVKQPAEIYKLEPDFDVDMIRLKLGEKRQPRIQLQTINDELFLTYQVQYEDLWLVFNLLVTKQIQ
ncbi:hypothetical protein [Candidatus Albibeggiatoa sp. nov. NOAA]|uniref:hypothetical protein n=1 Tax=Candidatus Albibeggiatoa sp. nov. NOAA TaxID=3162724 RepID=UPI00330174E3|nr:hypothetical protein [Thiotrichaceae bacterium]